ncbi:MAG: hypothetical protein SX243_23830 [Acidobacteriota bacterium]|nr:hypothetical protein [Acidobacteriota bacterium]
MVDAKNRQLGKPIDGVNHFYDGAGNLVRAGFQADGVSPAWEWTYDALNTQQRYKRTFPDGTFQEYIYLYGPGDLRLMEFDGATGVRKMTYRNLDGSLLREYEVSLRADKASGSTSRATREKSGPTRRTSSTAPWA